MKKQLDPKKFFEGKPLKVKHSKYTKCWDYDYKDKSGENRGIIVRKK